MEIWFESKGWEVFPFQRQVWANYIAGASGLIHSTTGSGKTYAAWGGALLNYLVRNKKSVSIEKVSRKESEPLRILWITPLRALASDTLLSLQAPIDELNLPWSVEIRTSDTSSSIKAKQRNKLPTALITTPESLSLLMTRSDFSRQMEHLEAVFVDEWHELMSTKRGSQTELALARLKTVKNNLRIWGLSATLGNLEESMEALLGKKSAENLNERMVVRGNLEKEIVIDTILPAKIENFPWAGHFGTKMIPAVVEELEKCGTSLVFTNTRAQSEIWFATLKMLKPEWNNKIALHHGSLSREERAIVESNLKSGIIRVVICTSSMDLGVDFSPVERIFQVGSPKGVARLLQRAGRSGHRPGVSSRITCVPTHLLELVDFAAAKDAVFEGKIEPRNALKNPLDVLTQHLVTVAVGEGFIEDELKKEVKTTFAFDQLKDEEWDWAMSFVTKGGEALRAYPEYQKVDFVDGRYVVTRKEIALRHKLSIGTITSDASIQVKTLQGRYLGTIEESFLIRLKPRDTFTFSGRTLEFLRMKDMTAIVRPSKAKSGVVPHWAGGRLPLSSELAHSIRKRLEKAKYGDFEGDPMHCAMPIFSIQAKLSKIPNSDELLIEELEDSEGHHIFFFPLEGRLIHEGLAALFAYRIAAQSPISFTMACNDYGFELLSPEQAPFELALQKGLFNIENLAADLVASLNSVEMSRRQFREIARISGLVYQGLPSASKSVKQVQSTSGLIFDVFNQFDPGNLLLKQAEREVLDQKLEHNHMIKVLSRLSQCQILRTNPEKCTPLAFPILVDRLRETLSTESTADRINRMSLTFEKDFN